MPLDPGTITGIMNANMVANGLLGPSVTQLAGAIGNALSQYAGSGLTAISVDTGLVGSGTGIGAGMLIAPSLFQAALQGTFAGALIIGPSAPLLINAISMGFSQALATAIINTTNVGVGVGAGVVSLIPSSGGPTFVAAFKAAGMAGPSSTNMATAVGTGFDIAIPAAKGIIAVAGPAGPAPSAGAGQGKIS
jgi:hypothetical protein